MINKIYKLPIKLSGVMEIYYIDSDMVMGTYDDRFNKQLDKRRGGFYYNFKTKKLRIFFLNNLKIKPHEMMAATNINARTGIISPDRSKFAIVMSYYPELDVFHVGDTTTTRYMLKHHLPPSAFDLKSFKSQGAVVYYDFIDATDNYIYLLYSGVKDKNEYSRPMYIQVLGWNGHPVAQYLIPAKYKLSLFNVDEKNECFYGLSYPNDAIYKFNYGPDGLGN